MERCHDRGRKVTYSNYVLTMWLPQSIDITRFMATKESFRAKLAMRQDIPLALRRLIEELFQRGAIVSCSISYGDRMDLKLPRTNERDHALLLGPALDHFSTTFAQITGQQIAATWADNGESRRRGRGSSIDGTALLRAVGAVVNVVSEGLQIAAAIKILTDDD